MSRQAGLAGGNPARAPETPEQRVRRIIRKTVEIIESEAKGDKPFDDSRWHYVEHLAPMVFMYLLERDRGNGSA